MGNKVAVRYIPVRPILVRCSICIAGLVRRGDVMATAPRPVHPCRTPSISCKTRVVWMYRPGGHLQLPGPTARALSLYHSATCLWSRWVTPSTPSLSMSKTRQIVLNRSLRVAFALDCAEILVLKRTRRRGVAATRSMRTANAHVRF